MKTPSIWITIGKRGFSEKNFLDLIRPNIDGIRINTGRSSYSWIYDTLEFYKKHGYSTENILLDIGNTKPRLSLLVEKNISLKAGDSFTISDKKSFSADAWLPYDPFFSEICEDDIVYFGDGEIECSVKDIQEHTVELVSTTNGSISDSVAIGIKGKNYFHFNISDEEIKAVNGLLTYFPMRLILSFVENGENIEWAKHKFPNAVSIIPKIETVAAVDNIDGILERSNCVFIGRGDLGLSAGIERIGIIQEVILHKAHKLGCKVSIGTGTLDSLKWSEVPLRAEIVDITNSCLKGVDTIVLTSETGGSTEPFKAIDYLEKVLNYIKKVG